MTAYPAPGNQSICTQCRSVALPRGRGRGSVVVAIALWFLFILPGLIYTLWMMDSGGDKLCPRCGAKNSMIPLSTPEGTRLVGDPARLGEGWYGDPAGKYDWRYWDGERWTNRAWFAGRETVSRLS